MKQERQLRFRVDEYFREVEADCTALRAAELARQFEIARDKAQPVSDERFPAAVAMSTSRAFREKYPEGVDVVEVRRRTRERLRDLKSALGTVHRPHIVYEILYPFTVHTDELIQSAAGSKASQWELLQSELFDMEFGGDEFYERLSARLSDDETHPAVFEAYFWCLSDQFGGRYRSSPSRREEYKDLLRQRIEIAKPPEADESTADVNPLRRVERSWPAWVYAAAVVAIVWTFVWLSGASRVAEALR